MFKQITYNPEPSVIGVDNGFCQLEFKEEHLRKHKDFYKINQMTLALDIEEYIQKQDEIISFQISTLKGTLLKKAKVTDFMVFAPFFYGCKYIISQKVLNCLKTQNISNNEYSLIDISIEGLSVKYYILRVPMIPNEKVNFPNSLIYHKDEFLSEQKNYLAIKNHDNYQQIMKKDPFHSFQKVSINKINQNKKIISLQGVNDLFFSQDLVESLQEANITNFRIPNKQIELTFSNPNPPKMT